MEAVTPKVSIIIPHYNQVECLNRLLPTVANQTFQNYEVIIIDDFTPDRSAPQYIRSLIKDYPRMRLVENMENMRFVRTCNRGIELARGDYVCLLNQDTEVRSNFVQRNVEIMDADPSIGALCCIVVDKDGNNWFTGGRFKNGYPVNLADDFRGIRTVDFVAGTACFYRKEVFNKIGLFDEDFTMYHEDVEYGLRMKAKTSYKACTFAEKLVVHYVVPSIPRRDLYYYINRNHIMLLRRYGKRYIPKIILLYSLRQVAGLLFVSVARLDLTRLACAAYVIRGTLDGLIRGQDY
jgi:hypothetical protein